jgi:hypothetical protein
LTALAGLNSRHEKIHSVRFEWTLKTCKVSPKISSNLGTEKISLNARITAGLELREQQESFLTYHLPKRAASRPGGQVPEMHWFPWGRGVALVAVAARITLS